MISSAKRINFYKKNFGKYFIEKNKKKKIKEECLKKAYPLA